MSDKIKKCREQIDHIDDELLKLFNQRAVLAQQIGLLKEDGAVLRPEREAQVLHRLKKANDGPLADEAVVQLFTEIISQCRALEAPLTVSYLGPEGTFSELATLKRFGSAVLGQPCATIDDVFHAVESGAALYGVVPVENSSEGAVGRTLDMLLQSNLLICGEVMLPVHQCLLAKCNQREISTVYSHPQSLAQCQGWLNKNLPGAIRTPVSSNAEAALQAAKHPQSSAAIAGIQTATRFGLNVIVENIEDESNNTTRFLVIGKQEVAASGRDKTSMVMSAPNRPGAVQELLLPLARHGVSMTKLESRPARAGLWEYVFFVDIEGHQSDKNVAIALEDLKLTAAFLKTLGSYPAAL